MSELHEQLFSQRRAVTETARACSISTAAVSQWRLRGIPKDREATVEQVLAKLKAGGSLGRGVAA